MISYLEGTIKYKGLNYLILMTTSGVGYKVYVPTDILSHIPPLSAGASAKADTHLYTYTYVKEDALNLYGFAALEDLALFELFLGVSGIGPKTALSIFGNGKIGKIKEAIVRGDVSFFTSVPRLGTKNAQKIIIELRPKLGSLGELDLTAETGETKEIVDALKSFGFSANEAREALKSIKDLEGTTSDKIRHALKYLGKK